MAVEEAGLPWSHFRCIPSFGSPPSTPAVDLRLEVLKRKCTKLMSHLDMHKVVIGSFLVDSCSCQLSSLDPRQKLPNLAFGVFMDPLVAYQMVARC